MKNLTEFQQRACAMGVVKMLSGTSFSICDLESLAKVMGRENMLAGKDYQALRSVHCIAWVDMGKELTTMVGEKCFEILGIPPVIIDSVCTKETTSEKPHEPAKRLRLAFWKSA